MDFDALKNALENDARYDTSVREGANGTVVTLLNEVDGAAAFVFHDVPTADVLEAAGSAKLKALAPEQRARLRIISTNGTVALSKPAIRAELLDVFGITEDQLATKLPAVRSRLRYGEAFGYATVGISVVRDAVRLIAKSHIVSTGQV